MLETRVVNHELFVRLQSVNRTFAQFAGTALPQGIERSLKNTWQAPKFTFLVLPMSCRRRKIWCRWEKLRVLLSLRVSSVS